MAEVGKLTEKQEQFCQRYLIDFNATKAAIEAGYAVSGASVEGFRLLRNANVQARIAKIREETGRGFNITRERIAQEYSRIAFFDIKKAFDDDGELIPVTQLDDDTAAAIAGIEVSNDWEKDENNRPVIVGQLKKIKISDKRSALDSLVKMMGYNAPEKAPIDDEGKTVRPEIHVKIIRDKATGLTPDGITSESTSGT